MSLRELSEGHRKMSVLDQRDTDNQVQYLSKKLPCCDCRMLGLHPPNQTFFKQSILPSLMWDLSIPTDFELNSEPQTANPDKPRRKKSPHRAICQPKDQVDRSFQRIVTLDVYAAFKANPAQLLGRKSSVSGESSDSDGGSKSPTTSTFSFETKSVKGSVSAVQSACRVLPSFIVQKEQLNFDISDFKQTKGAVNVNWKGCLC